MNIGLMIVGMVQGFIAGFALGIVYIRNRDARKADALRELAETKAVSRG